MLNKMGIGISSEKGGHLFCEQCGQTFPIRAKYRDVTRHLGSHEPIYGELQDCIVCHCDVEECPNYTLNNFFDLRETNGQFYLIFTNTIFRCASTCGLTPRNSLMSPLQTE